MAKTLGIFFGIILAGALLGIWFTTTAPTPPVTREQYDAAMSQTAQLQADLNTERQKSETLTAQRYEAERRADAVLAASGNDGGVVIVAVAGFVIIAGALLLVIVRGLNSGPSTETQMLLMRMQQNEARMDRIMAHLARTQGKSLQVTQTKARGQIVGPR